MNRYPFKLKIWNASVAGFTIAILASCSGVDPIYDLKPEEKDLYVTNRDRSVDFSDYKYYFIADSVHVVRKEFGVTEEEVVQAPLILSTVEAELMKAGFEKVNTPQAADIGIAVSALKFQDDVPVSYYPYVGGTGYYGYVSPAFYGYAGYGYAYPSYYGYYQIQAGSLSIEMFDLKSATISSENNLNVIWSALLAGSLVDNNNNEDNGNRIVKAIQSAFNQSPYLKDGK